MTSQDIAEAVARQGYAVLPDLYAADEVAAIRAPIASKYERLGRPRTWARPPRHPELEVEVSVVGLIFHHLGNHFPTLPPLLIRPDVVAAVRSVLGEDMHLEYTSAVVNFGDRPFFKWHMHIGGVDNILYRRRQHFPRFDRVERVATLLYLDDLNDAMGTLRVLPRRVDEPTEPPHDPDVQAWPGAIELACSAGTVVVMDQATWHAAAAKTSSGLRAFIACYWTAASAPDTSYKDASLTAFAGDYPLIDSVAGYERRDPEDPWQVVEGWNPEA